MRVLFFIVIAAVVAEDCNNGYECPVGHCTNTNPQSGSRFGCAPSNALVCNDRRFSCARGHTCGLPAGVCTGPDNSTFPLIINTAAHRIASPNLTVQGYNSVCDVIRPDLPSVCLCSNSSSGSLGGQVNCTINVLGIDTLDLIADIEPCTSPMFINFKVEEKKIGFHYQHRVAAGTLQELDIGLDIGIPEVGNAGVYVAVEIDGTLSALALKLGVDICATVSSVGRECGSKLPLHNNPLPYWILDAAFHLSDVCDRVQH